jgi:glycerophosphoryl diester phosphodiesterase
VGKDGIVVDEVPRRAVPIAFAHRGARAERRENTLEAFLRALELGASGLESDAWVTSEGAVVLDHDGVFGPPWRRRGVRDITRSELPGHVPTLPELYSACGADFELSLDVKDRDAFSGIVEAARAAAAADRLWLCHPDKEVLGRWRREAPEVRLVHSTRVPAAAGPAGFASYLATLDPSLLDAVNMRNDDWDSSRVASVHQLPLLAFGWNAHSRRRIDRLLGMGVDGVYSDHPGVAVSSISERFSDP